MITDNEHEEGGAIEIERKEVPGNLFSMKADY